MPPGLVRDAKKGLEGTSKLRRVEGLLFLHTLQTGSTLTIIFNLPDLTIYFFSLPELGA